MTRSKSSSLPSAIGWIGMMPALFTTTSIRPKASSVSRKRRSTSGALATSAGTAIARPSAASISVTSSWARAGLPA